MSCAKQEKAAREDATWVSSTHIHEESARVCACAGTQVLIASSWYLDSNLENRDLLSQLKCKLLRPLEPDSLAFGGKAVCKMRVSFPRKKKFETTGKKNQVHATSSNTLSSESATGF